MIKSIILIKMNLIPAYPAPDFRDIDRWSNGSVNSIKDFKGKTILLDFWTYTCIYCLRTIPTVNKIKEKYQDKGLEIISIHSAEYEFAKDIANIEKAITELNLNKYLIGFDIKNKTWESYGNSYWPKHIFVDKQGFIRYEHPGYGTSKSFEEAIQDLLDIPYKDERKITREKEKKGEFNKVNKENHLQDNGEEGEEERTNEIIKIYGMHFMDMAPEICLGYSRIRRFGNNQRLKPNEYNILTDQNTILDNNVYLRGKWRWDKEGVKASLDNKEKDPAIIIKYNKAANVNIIAGPDNNKTATAEIKIDNQFLEKEQAGTHIKIKNGKSIIETTWPFVYNIVKTKEREVHKVEIIPRSENFYFYTFVFG
jgi:thiol-disulfide isomerase/thioredoxin